MAHLPIATSGTKPSVPCFDHDQNLEGYWNRTVEDFGYANFDLQSSKGDTKQTQSFIDMERRSQEQQEGSDQAATGQRLEGVWRQPFEYVATAATSCCSCTTRMDMRWAVYDI